MVKTKTVLSKIEHLLLTKVSEIEYWFRHEWTDVQAPMMSSVDLRNAGFKLAPVDTNLFPAGFNNLNPMFFPMCVQAIQSIIFEQHPNCLHLLLIPEVHTRNKYYADSLLTLKMLMMQAGLTVSLGHWERAVELANGLKIQKIEREGNLLKVGKVKPCLVLLNNDLSSGIPTILQDIDQPIYPPLHLGWSTRRKSAHFKHYSTIAHAFTKKMGCDPWWIDPFMASVENIDFLEQTGFECLIDAVESVFSAIQNKYDEYDLKEKPFVVVKADNGTYGMGIMVIRDINELRTLNRKQRTKMAVGKGGQAIRHVMIQEGVYTFETLPDGAVAEPVLYLIGSCVVGGFYRAHQTKGIDDNLNSPGMHFEQIAFNAACNIPACEEIPSASPVNKFYVYSVIARLAALAAGKEALHGGAICE